MRFIIENLGNLLRKLRLYRVYKCLYNQFIQNRQVLNYLKDYKHSYFFK